MSHSKAAASPVQNLEITLAPSTPKRGTKRGVEAGEDAETPNAMRRTVSLPQSFDMGTINLKTTTENMRAQTGPGTHTGEGDTHNHKRIPHNRSTRRVFWVQGVLRCSCVGGPAPSEGGH